MSRKLLVYYCPGCGYENGQNRTEIADVWSDAPVPQCPKGHGFLFVRIGAPPTVRSFKDHPNLARILDQAGPRRKPSEG
jgi:hypothetical protein